MYKQIEGHYSNNEYPNMPSIDVYGETLTTRTAEQYIDFKKVDEIVKKHGCDFIIVKNCMMSYGEYYDAYVMEVLIYKRLQADDYERYERARSEKDWDAVREFNKKFYEDFRKMHDCIHELDENTRLYFPCGSLGTYGCFGSKDGKRKSYLGCTYARTSRMIMSDYDTRTKKFSKPLPKGVYAIEGTWRYKTEVETD